MSAENKVKTQQVELSEQRLREVSHKLYEQIIDRLSNNRDFSKALVSNLFKGNLNVEGNYARVVFESGKFEYSLYLRSDKSSIKLTKEKKGKGYEGYEQIVINPYNHEQLELLGIEYRKGDRQAGHVGIHNSEETVSKIEKFIQSI